MNENDATAYSDGAIRCDDQAVTIRRYYPWGAKRIPYTSIKSVQRLPLTGANAVRRWRIWGTGNFVHWWNLDPHRPKRTSPSCSTSASACAPRSHPTTRSPSNTSSPHTARTLNRIADSLSRGFRAGRVRTSV